MKKLLTAVLSLSLLGAAALPALAAGSEPPAAVSPGTEVTAPAPEGDQTAQGFSIEIDGSGIDAPAHITVPLRAVAEKLGFTVAWDNGVVTVTGTGRYVRLTVGENQYFAAPHPGGDAGRQPVFPELRPLCGGRQHLCTRGAV